MCCLDAASVKTLFSQYILRSNFVASPNLREPLLAK